MWTNPARECSTPEEPFTIIEKFSPLHFTDGFFQVYPVCVAVNIVITSSRCVVTFDGKTINQEPCSEVLIPTMTDYTLITKKPQYKDIYIVSVQCDSFEGDSTEQSTINMYLENSSTKALLNWKQGRRAQNIMVNTGDNTKSAEILHKVQIRRSHYSVHKYCDLKVKFTTIDLDKTFKQSYYLSNYKNISRQEIILKVLRNYSISSMSWQDANRECRKNDVHLPYFRTYEEYQYFTYLVFKYILMGKDTPFPIVIFTDIWQMEISVRHD